MFSKLSTEKDQVCWYRTFHNFVHIAFLICLQENSPLKVGEHVASDFIGRSSVFIDFVNAYLLLDNSPGIASTGVSSRDRLNYIMDQNNPTPGEERFFSRLGESDCLRISRSGLA